MKKRVVATAAAARRSAAGLVRRYWLLGAAGLALAVHSTVGLLVLSYLLIAPNRQYIISDSAEPAAAGPVAEVGLVLGAGIRPDGKPYRELQDRLDTAAAALSAGTVQKLLLSGDNRFAHYNEPQAMKNYLVQDKGVSEDRLQLDYAGRSTYESCERAAKVFRQERLLVISAPSHLPRAIYTCRHFGIDAYGVGGSVEANNSRRRELLARVKAVLNVYVIGERTVLGAAVEV